MAKWETLINGIKRYNTRTTEGGGKWMRFSLIHEIMNHGAKSKYNRAYEWCSGSAAIGFAMLDLDLVEHITFSDKHELSIEECSITITENKLHDRGNAYVSDTIAGLPEMPLWDLVVSNPPHQKNVIRECEFQSRIIEDIDWKTHKEFYKNIRSRLTNDAELFIIEHIKNCVEVFEPMANQGGLKLIDTYPMTMASAKALGATYAPNAGGLEQTWQIMHFKPMELQNGD